jgi:hypothetical protein
MKIHEPVRGIHPSEESTPPRLLIPLDAEEAFLALGRFRYSTERDRDSERISGVALERPAA